MKPLSLLCTVPLSTSLLLLTAGCQPASKTFGPTPVTSRAGEKSKAAAAATTAASAAAAAAVQGNTLPPAPAADGTITTLSGLRYQVIASGPEGGRSPTLNDTVTVHYRGTLTNGTVFDSSYDRGAPTSFGVGQVIPGWTEALQLMKPGDKWKLYIPSRLAYGPRAMGDKIPANSDLIFDVELLQVGGGL